MDGKQIEKQLIPHYSVRVDCDESCLHSRSTFNSKHDPLFSAARWSSLLSLENEIQVDEQNESSEIIKNLIRLLHSSARRRRRHSQVPVIIHGKCFKFQSKLFSCAPCDEKCDVELN